MKGNTLHNIVRNLDAKAYQDFLAFVSAVPGGKELATVCEELHKTATYSEATMLNNLQTSKYHKNKHLAQLGELLLQRSVIADEEAKLQSLHTLAKQQLYARNYPAAEDLINMAMPMAEQLERPKTIIELWELVDDFSIRPAIDGMAADVAERLHDNLTDYERLMRSARKACTVTDAAARRLALEGILHDPLLGVLDNALTQRAIYLYYKVAAVCLVNLLDHAPAVPLQEALLAHIRQYPWVLKERDFETVREMEVLSVLYWKTGQWEAFERLSAEVQATEVHNLRAEEEKVHQCYPWRISLALDNGDQEAGKKACNGFLKTVEHPAISFSTTFVTQNLYCCAYFFIAIEDWDSAGKMLVRCRKFTKTEFHSKYFHPSRLLEIVHAIETEELKAANQHIKNALASKGVEELPGFKDVMLFFERSIKKIEEESPNELAHAFKNIPLKLRDSLEGQLILDYFDIFAWSQSRQERCPMIEIFHQRASPAS